MPSLRRAGQEQWPQGLISLRKGWLCGVGLQQAPSTYIQKGGVGLFVEIHGGGQRDRGHKLKQREYIYLDMKGGGGGEITLRLFNHLCEFHSEAVESPS